MKRIGKFICEKRKIILILTILLLIPALIGIKATKINYDILVYLPEDIDTVKGQNILADDFNTGAFSVTVIDNLPSKDILKLEEKIKKVDGVAKVVSGYDALGTVPIDMLPNDISSKLKQGNSSLMLITYDDSTSSERTLDAVKEVKSITKGYCKIGGMSALVLDTMDLSETEIAIYILVAVILCIVVLELSLNSYLVPILLLLNIGIAILYNLGTNIIFGEISYITKALVAVLQLGVTTDFSIFLYHSYENKKDKYKTKEEAMEEAISETFTSVLGSSLTTIAGFLVLCTMNLTLGKDLGLVMAKGVLLGVICTLTVFPVLLLTFDKLIEKTKHKSILPKFNHLSNFIIKYHKVIFTIFIILLVPAYLANSKVEVYYKLDETLPKTLDSIKANEELKSKFNIVSPEIILVDSNMKTNDINNMINEIKSLDGVEFVLSSNELSNIGLDKNMLSKDTLSIFENDKYQMILLNSTYDIATNELNNQVVEIQNIINKYDKNALLAGEGPLMKDLVTISDEDFNNVNSSSIIAILLIMFLVLKSFSLPILLIFTIEFAIFVNMSIPYFSGITLPFVAPIVLGTIQLGATIDYAILMTTTYLGHRKEGKDKQEAIREALSTSINSIVVSALCFFGATFGVGVYSKLEMISSLCSLISRGAIISMLVVILVLPSILLIFDKLILRTTLGFRKENKNMKKIAKKTLAVLMLSLACFSSLPVYALEKDETVYAKLNSDGTTKNITVNEHLINNTKQDTLEDLTDLKDILNINGDEKFAIKDNSLVWTSNGQDIFYQGKIEKDLPISVDIKYYLDGEEKELKDIIGKSGRISISLNYHNNEKHNVKVGDTYEELYTPFVVTTATTIDSKNNSNVEVTNGKVVNNGTKFVVVALASPGLYKSLNIDKLSTTDNITISYDTTSFELSSIYSVVTSKLLDEEDLKVFDKVNLLAGNINTLETSINTIEEGANKLNSASTKLSEGSSLISEKLNVVNEKLEEIKEGNLKLDEGLKQVLAALEEVKSSLNSSDNSKLESLNYLMSLNTSSVNSIKEKLSTLKLAYDTYNLGNLTNEQIYSATKEYYQSIGLPITTDEEAMNTNIKLLNIKYMYEENYENNKNIQILLEENNNAFNSTLETINSLTLQVNNAITLLEDNITKIESGASTLYNGTTELSTGVNTLSKKMEELSTGSSELSTGINTLSEGITKFNNEGISKITSYTKEAKDLSDKVEALTKLGQDYQTFTLKNSSDEGNTKFVLVVDGVKNNTSTTKKTSTTKDTSFWTKFKELFK